MVQSANEMTDTFGFHLSRNRTPRNVKEEEKQLIYSAFHDCDHGSKGFLSKDDLKIAVVYLFGYKPSKYEVKQLLEDADDMKGLSLDAFVRAMSIKMSSVDEDEEIRQMFVAFDAKCRGFLTVEELGIAFAAVAPHLPAHRVEAAFREIDRDGDGRVSYKDFEFMMKYSTDSGF